MTESEKLPQDGYWHRWYRWLRKSCSRESGGAVADTVADNSSRGLHFDSSHSVAVWIFLAVVVIPLTRRREMRCPRRSRHPYHPHLPVDHPRILLLLLLLLVVMEYDHYVHGEEGRCGRILTGGVCPPRCFFVIGGPCPLPFDVVAGGIVYYYADLCCERTGLWILQ